MNDNVINPVTRIQFFDNGSLELVGFENESNTRVSILVTDFWFCSTKTIIEKINANFQTEAKIYWCGNLAKILFSSETEGLIRHPEEFLKSIRRKLVAMVRSTEAEELKEEQDREDDRRAYEMAYGR